jgi:hypothetical protein
MKIVKIYGGLGNQMFQYAFALSLSARSGEEVYIDTSAFESDLGHNGFELDKIFKIELPTALDSDVTRLAMRPAGLVSRVLRKYFTKPSHFIDRRFSFQPELFEAKGDRYYDGYWQSEKYFLDIEDVVRANFSFKQGLDGKNLALLRELPRPIASVHVRRGDYLKYPTLDLCSPAYYLKASRALKARAEVASFLVLSDDIEYCRTKLDLGGPATFVDWNRGAKTWQDMALMASCDHHIVANSSFSWWGAWLDPSPGKQVIAPSIWNGRELGSRDRFYRFSFDDVVPGSWHRVDPFESEGQ